MSLDAMWTWVGYAIYAALGLCGLAGLSLIILLLTRIRQKQLSSGDTADFGEALVPMLRARDWSDAETFCDQPQYWTKAVPQMMLIALRNLHLSPNKLRLLLAERFEREVLGDLEIGVSWITTVVKSAPMLGLLGTVTGMIQAFGKIATAQQSGGDPKALANEISFALFTTAIGLTVAIPLVIAVAYIQVRLGKLTDSVQDQLSDMLEVVDASTKSSAKAS